MGEEAKNKTKEREMRQLSWDALVISNSNRVWFTSGKN
jgi:hypothetical protein